MKDLEVRFLENDAEGRIIAGWYHEEWKNAPPYLTMEQELEELRSSYKTDDSVSLPFTIVGHLQGIPVGVVTVDAEDLATGRKDIGPWITSTFVPSHLRGRKIASGLLRETEDILKKVGYHSVYAATRNARLLYEVNGYVTIGAHQKDVTRYDILEKTF